MVNEENVEGVMEMKQILVGRDTTVLQIFLVKEINSQGISML